MGRMPTRANPRDPSCDVIRIAAFCLSRLGARMCLSPGALLFSKRFSASLIFGEMAPRAYPLGG